jgi:hypothetical protein
LFGGLVFWIFCGSRYTAISVTSAISLVIGSSLAEITGGNTMRFGALAAGTALLVSLIAFIAWLAKAGVMVFILASTLLVFLSLIEVVATIILDNTRKKERAKKIDRYCRVIFPVIFALATIGIFFHARD